MRVESKVGHEHAAWLVYEGVMRTPEKPPGHLHILNPNARAYESGMGCFATPGSLCKHYADSVPAKDHFQAPATILVGGKAKPPKQPKAFVGIEVHSKSKIQATSDDPTSPGWVQMIQKCNSLPKHFRDHIKAKGGILWIPANFKEPKGEERDWFADWKKAFESDTWECTTANLRFTVKKPPPLPKGKPPPPKPKKAVRSEMEPDISDGEVLMKSEPLADDDDDDNPLSNPLVKKWETPNSQGFGIEWGLTRTKEQGVKLADTRREGIVIITTRVTLNLGDAPEQVIKRSPDEILWTWFHELACHAGRYSAGRKVYEHRKPDEAPNDVDRIDGEIDSLFKLGGATDATYKDVVSRIRGYWSSSAK